MFTRKYRSVTILILLIALLLAPIASAQAPTPPEAVQPDATCEALYGVANDPADPDSAAAAEMLAAMDCTPTSIEMPADKKGEHPVDVPAGWAIAGDVEINSLVTHDNSKRTGQLTLVGTPEDWGATSTEAITATQPMTVSVIARWGATAFAPVESTVFGKIAEMVKTGCGSSCVGFVRVSFAYNGNDGNFVVVPATAKQVLDIFLAQRAAAAAATP